MGGTDILKELEREDGLERNELFKRVSHLVNQSSFKNNIRSLLKSRDIIKIERGGTLRHPKVRFFLNSDY